LHKRIEERFKMMVRQGLLDEVKSLMKRGDLTPELPSMRCVGYRQAWEHLEGKTSMNEFMAAGIAATRQLAKRQITWLRSFEGLHCIDPLAQTPKLSELVSELS
jgi:tRNA dimethylallyltransferase